MAYTWPPTLADVKKLAFRGNSSDTTYDDILPKFIDAAVAVVENIVGPVNSTAVTEWHDGGNGARFAIVLRQRPVISVETVTGFIGNNAQTFAQVADPSLATSYSYTFEAETGTLNCRVGSGTLYPFPWGVQNIEVAYHAGQATPPANVHLACIEVVRNLWDMSQQGGAPKYAGAAEDDIPSPWSGYAVTPHVRELLSPNMRIPGIA